MKRLSRESASTKSASQWIIKTSSRRINLFPEVILRQWYLFMQAISRTCGHPNVQKVSRSVQIDKTRLFMHRNLSVFICGFINFRRVTQCSEREGQWLNTGCIMHYETRERPDKGALLSNANRPPSTRELKLFSVSPPWCENKLTEEKQARRESRVSAFPLRRLI